MKHNNNFFPLESEIPKELLLAEQLEQNESRPVAINISLPLAA